MRPIWSGVQHAPGNTGRQFTRLILACSLAGTVAISAAQYPGLAWIAGSKNFDAIGTFGTKGTPAADNTPVGRNLAGTWTDLEGNLWLYGGVGYGGGGDTTVGRRSDLWKFDAGLRQWIWISGEATTLDTAAVHGEKGVPHPSNTPGARSRFATWTGTDGSLWLYGGEADHPENVNQSIFMADLWKYDIPSSTWTWVSGSTANFEQPVYGTEKVFAEGNYPGSRFGSSGWVDSDGNLWLFGGITIRMSGPFPSPSPANDLWKYDIAINQWAWMKGSRFYESDAVYGVQGVAAEANTPGPRLDSVSWKDGSGNFWLMGGDTINDSSNLGGMNDVWKFDPISNNWTWMDGSTLPNQAAEVDEKGLATETNQPSGRSQHAGTADADGNLWIFGGHGYAAEDVPALLSDTWKYDITTGMWTWIYGTLADSQPGVYGFKGVAGSTNTPGWRIGASGLTDGFGDIYFFGGHGAGEASTGLMSDLWKQPLETAPTAAEGWEMY